MTRKIIFLLSVLLVSLSAEAESRIDKLLRNLHDKNSQYVFVIAHRGDWRNAPENSIQCIENEQTWWNLTFSKPKTTTLFVCMTQR